MITTTMKKYLSGKAHHLKPVVIIGSNGLTDNVNAEIDRALNDHELIKIRISEQEREVRRSVADTILTTHHAELVKTIGHIVAIYRQRPPEKSKKSNKKK